MPSDEAPVIARAPFQTMRPSVLGSSLPRNSAQSIHTSSTSKRMMEITTADPVAADTEVGSAPEGPLRSPVSSINSGMPTVVAYTAADILEGYKYFTTSDIEVTGQLEARHLVRLLTDVDGKPKDMPFLTFAVELPELDCGLQFEEKVDAEDEPMVLIRGVEGGSPAMSVRSLVVGLRLVSLNDIPVDTIASLTAAMKATSKALKRSRAEDNKAVPVVMRFQEPAYVVDTYNDALTVSVTVPRSRQGRTRARSFLDIADDRLVNCTLRYGAYNTREEFVSMVREKLLEAVAAREDVPGDWDVLLIDGDVEIRSSVCPFKLLFRTGEGSQRSACNLLGFPHEDTREALEHRGRRPRIRGLDLSYLRQDQLERCATYIMDKYDSTGDAVMNFEEFLKFYKEYLLSMEAIEDLADWIHDHFLTADEARQREEMKIMEQELERRRQNIERERERQRQIRKAQWEAIKATLKVEDDGQTRRRTDRPRKRNKRPARLKPVEGGTMMATAPPTRMVDKKPRDVRFAEVDEFAETQPMSAFVSGTLEQLSGHAARRADDEEEERRMAHEKAMRTREIKERQHLAGTGKARRIIANLEETAIRNADGVAERDEHIIKLIKNYGRDLVALDKAAVLHPCFIGYLTSSHQPRAQDPSVLHPIFFGYHYMQDQRCNSHKLLAAKQLQKDIVRGIRKVDTSVWKVYPTPRLNTTFIRHQMKNILPEMYDAGEMIHPACFGRMMYRTAGGAVSSANVHPSMLGYSMEHKPAIDPRDRKVLSTVLKEKQPMLCEVCTVGKPGCPSCWQMPVGFSATDFEYKGYTCTNEAAPSIHTHLTTERAVLWHRKLNCDYITIYVKSLPLGEIVVLRVEKGDTVGGLYHLYATNASRGNEPCYIYLPHAGGCLAVDNAFFPESDLASEIDLGRTPLTAFNLKKQGTKVVMFHLTVCKEEHALPVMSQYLRTMLAAPIPAVYPIIYDLKKHVPLSYEADPVQAGLITIVEQQLENIEKYRSRTETQVESLARTRLKGTVQEDSPMLRRRQGNKDVRDHEINKILALKQIKIIEGAEKDVELERRPDKVRELLMRQRYHKKAQSPTNGGLVKAPPNAIIALAQSNRLWDEQVWGEDR